MPNSSRQRHGAPSLALGSFYFQISTHTLPFQETSGNLCPLTAVPKGTGNFWRRRCLLTPMSHIVRTVPVRHNSQHQEAKSPLREKGGKMQKPQHLQRNGHDYIMNDTAVKGHGLPLVLVHLCFTVYFPSLTSSL